MVKTVHGLPLQSALHEYRVDQVLGVGGFGITCQFAAARRAQLERRMLKGAPAQND